MAIHAPALVEQAPFDATVRGTRPMDRVVRAKCSPSRQQSLKVVVFSNYAKWATAAIETLVKEGHRVILLLSAKQECAEVGRQHGIDFVPFPVCPESIRFPRYCVENADYRARAEEAYDVARARQPDLLMTCGFYVLPGHVLSIPTVAALNVHPSDLPRYRGAMPWQSQILRGEEFFRVSVHKLSEVIDDPACVLAKSSLVSIGPGADLESMLEQTFAATPEAVSAAVRELLAPAAAAHQLRETPQASPEPLPHAFAMRTEKFLDGATGERVASNAGVVARARIEWGVDSASDIARAVRAFRGGAYGAFTDLDGSLWLLEECAVGPPLSATRFVDATDVTPGTILEFRGEESGAARATVATVDGAVVYLRGRSEASKKAVGGAARFHSVTSVSARFGQRGLDWCPGGERFGISAPGCSA